MKRQLMAFFGITLALILALTPAAFAQQGKANIRVVHASPDAPAVDILVDGNAAFQNAPYKGITNYAELDADTYNIQVVPAGATTPVVIEADLPLEAGRYYTVVAVGQLENIEPLVLTDNNSAPAAGKAHVRFVHTSPDAPAVDIAVTGGPTLFSNIAFKQASDYLPVDAGTYDLEARPAGSSDVALAVPGVQLEAGTVYTIFAMGLAGGQPALEAVPSVDVRMPTTLPQTGGNDVAGTWSLTLALALGAALLTLGLALRFSPKLIRRK